VKTCKEERERWKKYTLDCDALWVRYGRSASQPPPPEYVAAKERLKEELDADLEKIRKTRIVKEGE
jgi:hypothetical protein